MTRTGAEGAISHRTVTQVQSTDAQPIESDRKLRNHDLSTHSDNLGEDNVPHGFGQWIRVLKEIKDDELKLIAGTDAALYIVFNRYAAIFFFLMTIFNFVVLLPIYATGFPSDPDDILDKDKKTTIVIALLTSINITGYISK